MRILIVEDEEHMIRELVERLGSVHPPIDVTVARSRSSAIEVLKAEEFDFIVCDLRLPPNDGGLDTNEAHGLAVHSEARALCPGTPCLFFTGFATETNVRDQLSSGGAQDVLGAGAYGMTQLLTKDELLECIERLEAFNAGLASLDAITIETEGSDLQLDEVEKRALQMAALRLAGTVVETAPLGGRSGARTLRASVMDEFGYTRASFFVKIANRERIEAERQNYDKYVHPLLGIGSYPALGSDRDAGLRKRRALFYQLADDYTTSLFDLAARDDILAASALDSVRDILRPWSKPNRSESMRIGQLRSQRISDKLFQPFAAAIGTSPELEDQICELTTNCQHGDFHGLNILCNAAGNALVIDFGNVGIAPACLDPVLLELSALFHIDSPFRGGEWPTVAQAATWFDLDEYLRGCPIPAFIRGCREWAVETGGLNGLAPVVYAEAVRQLKYDDTDHGLAIAVGNAAVKALL